MGFDVRDLGKQLVRIRSSGFLSAEEISLGRPTPWLMLDTDRQPALAAAIAAHREVSLGEAETRWSHAVIKPDAVYLRIQFHDPVDSEFFVEFPLALFADAALAIMRARAVILVDGMGAPEGARPVGRPQMSLEVPNTGYEEHFHKILHRYWARQLRSRGVPRNKARTRAKRKVAEVTEYGAWFD